LQELGQDKPVHLVVFGHQHAKPSQGSPRKVMVPCKAGRCRVGPGLRDRVRKSGPYRFAG
jgi:hypothetical protein